MRKKNSIINMIVGLVGQLLNMLLSFGGRMVFVHYLSQEYLGVNGSICPFSHSDISLCYGEKEQSFDSIDALMHAPFFKGKSLTEICSKVNFE